MLLSSFGIYLRSSSPVELLHLLSLTYCCTLYTISSDFHFTLCLCEWMPPQCFSYCICIYPMSEHCKRKHKPKLLSIWKEEWTVSDERRKKKSNNNIVVIVQRRRFHLAMWKCRKWIWIKTRGYVTWRIEPP